jgi:hypothetical protein
MIQEIDSVIIVQKIFRLCINKRNKKVRIVFVKSIQVGKGLLKAFPNEKWT